MNVERPTSDTVILIPQDGMGHAEQALRHQLLGTYLQLLLENEIFPGVVCFYTAGVKLVVEGSPVLEELRALEEKGVYLLSCGTCLNFYGLTEQIAVGIKGGMTDILEAQWRAGKVITL